MSWSTSAILIRSRLGEDPARLFELLGLGEAIPLGSADWDEAGSLSLPGRALAVAGEWTILFDPMMFLGAPGDEDQEHGASFLPRGLESRLVEVSRESEVLAFLMSGVSGTFGLARFADGAMSRALVLQQGGIIKQSGAPDADEEAAFAAHADEEQAIFALCERRGVRWETAAQAEFGVFELAF
jgi:hypothetical protein